MQNVFASLFLIFLMKKARSSYPTSADLVSQTKQEFDNPGADIIPLPVSSEKEAQKEIDFLIQNIDEKQDWDVQVKAIKRGMADIRGGAMNYQNFVSGLSSFSSALVAASCNLRSTLVKASCLFIVQIAQHLRAKFSCIGEVIAPLSKQTSNGTMIIAESCKQTIEQIAKYCPSKSVFQSISALATSRSGPNRQIAAESFILILNYWDTKIVQNHLQ